MTEQQHTKLPNKDKKISQRGIDLIKRFEGFRSKAYKCPAGVWTIGYGHTLNVKQGDKITEPEAEELLKRDIEIAECAVRRYGKPLTQGQYDALVSFTFNCGSYNFSRLARPQRTVQQVGNALVSYVYGSGKQQIEGLVRRRKEEQDMFFDR